MIPVLLALLLVLAGCCCPSLSYITLMHVLLAPWCQYHPWLHGEFSQYDTCSGSLPFPQNAETLVKKGEFKGQAKSYMQNTYHDRSTKLPLACTCEDLLALYCNYPTDRENRAVLAFPMWTGDICWHEGWLSCDVLHPFVFLPNIRLTPSHTSTVCE